ncbi:glycosyltransferase family 2 protein [Streptococcus himalayensis]|uniref:Glycosyl transferase n=1 Tax=Streptococcus himalayensis TaxID=1888195 RepID=A0A917EE91_9STRE|nr:glycosyltransferase family 2 protein [Streptococcus himalayensis]GGE24827.1 glycosyl transferase [Streptococcus himalayensis]
MEHLYTLTIVIPAYNMERYIARAIESLLAIDGRYWADFEILVINDGSTDLTAEMTEACMEEFSGAPIRLISKENGGHGSAINCGIAEAKGAYFKVLDGDDWVDRLAFEALLDALRDIEVDMVVTDFTRRIPAYGQSIHEQPVDSSLARIVQSVLPTKRLPMHSLTYKTALLQEHQFRLTEGMYYVDVEYSLFPMQYVTSWLYLSLNVYQYLFGREGQSVTLVSLVKNAAHHLQVLENVFEFRQNLSDSPLKAMTDDTIASMLEVQEMINPHSEQKTELSKQTRYLREIYNF